MHRMANPLNTEREYLLKMPLELHEVTLADDIWDPFGIDDSSFEYVTPVKADEFSYTDSPADTENPRVRGQLKF